jgi:hypothetical protein
LALRYDPIWWFQFLKPIDIGKYLHNNGLYAIAIAILFKSTFCYILKTGNQFYSKSHVN